MKTLLFTLTLSALFLAGCNGNKFSASTEESPTNNSSGDPVAFTVESLATGSFITESTSSDPRALTCANAGGIYVIDPNTGSADTYCLVGGTLAGWRTLFTEISDFCNQGELNGAHNKAFSIFNSTQMDTNLFEVDYAYFTCMPGDCTDGKNIDLTPGNPPIITTGNACNG